MTYVRDSGVEKRKDFSRKIICMYVCMGVGTYEYDISYHYYVNEHMKRLSGILLTIVLFYTTKSAKLTIPLMAAVILA